MAQQFSEEIPVVDGDGKKSVVPGKQTWASTQLQQKAPKTLQIEEDNDILLSLQNNNNQKNQLQDLMDLEEKAEIEKVAQKAEVEKKIVSSAHDYQATAEVILTESKVPLKNMVMRKRIAMIVALYLRGVRQDFETRSILERSPTQGGAGLRKDVVEAIMSQALQHIQNEDFVPQTSVEKSAIKEAKMEPLKRVVPKIPSSQAKHDTMPVSRFENNKDETIQEMKIDQKTSSVMNESMEVEKEKKDSKEVEKSEPIKKKGFFARLFGGDKKQQTNDNDSIDLLHQEVKPPSGFVTDTETSQKDDLASDEKPIDIEQPKKQAVVSESKNESKKQPSKQELVLPKHPLEMKAKHADSLAEPAVKSEIKVAETAPELPADGDIIVEEKKPVQEMVKESKPAVVLDKNKKRELEKIDLNDGQKNTMEAPKMEKSDPWHGSVPHEQVSDNVESALFSVEEAEQESKTAAKEMYVKHDEEKTTEIKLPDHNVLGVDYEHPEKTPPVEPSPGPAKKSSEYGTLVSPVDELRYSIEDFRRLAFNPNDRIKKIISKVKLLEDESFTNKLLGIRAWRESEVFDLYITIGESGLFTNKTVDQIIEEREAKKSQVLTKLEFEVVAKINMHLSV